MNNRLFIISLISLAVSSGAAREIVVNPGELAEKIIQLKGGLEEDLTIKGTTTSMDLTSLRMLPPDVSTLDLSQLSVKGCEATDGGWFGITHFEDGELPAYMLMGTNVASIKLPASIAYLGTGAFSGTPISELSLTGLKGIGEGVFYGCKELKKVTLSGPDFIEIPDNLFAGCTSLEEVKLPSVITRIGKRAFEKTAVKSVFLPRLEEIDDYAFAFADKLTEIYFANGCKMGEGVFCATKSLENIPAIPSNYPSLYTAFGEYRDTLSIKTAEVEDGAFAGSRISALGLSPEVRRIGKYSFSSMPNLKSVDVGGCEVISDVDPTSFSGNDLSAVTLYVAKGEVEKWKNAPVWCEFNISDDESGVENISAETIDIEIRYADGVISVVSSAPIDSFVLYSLEGLLLYSSADLDPSTAVEGAVRVDFPEGEEMVIARASGKGGTKIKKIIR